MQVERFYLGCLAHASYLIHDRNEAAVIDPQRDVDLYIAEAAARNITIRWVIETHLHADFVSGHLELADRTGATICISAEANASFPHSALHDGDELPLGAGTLRVLATPGHTEEGVSILALEPGTGKPLCVFTGDTLFIGDVGRPDLSPTHTPQQLAGLLYDSLQNRLLALPDDTIVYPAHGAGSLCGRQMSNDASSTIGRERRTNYALQARDRNHFIDLLTGDLPPRPAYFTDDVALNRAGAAPLEALAPVPTLSPADAVHLRAEGAVLLDVRPAQDFAAAHISGSLHIALSGQFASWAARLLGVEARIVLIAEDDSAIEEARTRLARVGMENVLGSLSLNAWIESGHAAQSVAQITATDLNAMLEEGPADETILDVREPSEREHGAIPHSLGIPLPQLQQRLAELDPAQTIIVHCKGGYRSSCATSLLQAAGFTNVVNLTGGYDAWELAHSLPA